MKLIVKTIQCLALCSFLFLGACEVEGVATVPDEQTEVVGVAPWPGAIWIGGDWIWSGGRYVWHGGHWEHPREGRTWERGHWNQGSHGYRWNRGRWR